MADPLISTETVSERIERRRGFGQSLPDATIGAQGEMISETHTMLRRLLAAQTDIIAPRLDVFRLTDILRMHEDDETQLRMLLGPGQSVPVCTLADFKTMARACLMILPLDTEEKRLADRTLDFEKRRRELRFVNLIRRTVLTMLREALNEIHYTEGEVNSPTIFEIINDLISVPVTEVPSDDEQ